MINKFTLALFFSISFFSVKAQQVPQAINYQAVARTANGLIIPAQNINVRFSVLDATVNGTTVYQETHSATTNNFGLFTLSIGKGTVVTGTFAGINWSSADKFLKVEISTDATNNYQLQGTSQLLSVPYALYAEKTKLLAGNNTINITGGNTITGNYQAANNTVLLTGNTIAGNYLAANNTVLLTGNTIAGNYQPGVGINLAGNTISHNMVAGTGINITGNTISSTVVGGSQWLNHPNGIYYPTSGSSGNVGIRTTPVTAIAFVSNGDIPGVLEGNAGLFTSNSTWHTDINIKNNNVQYSLVVGGPTNTELLINNFGIFNGVTARWPFTINGANNNIGIGDPSPFPSLPKSSLHIKKGDTYIEEIGSGIILRSPNGQCWRITIDNAGNLVRTSIICPS
jgi:hypothetical protein